MEINVARWVILVSLSFVTLADQKEELLCKARPGCQLAKCDPARSISLGDLTKNEYPVTCVRSIVRQGEVTRDEYDELKTELLNMKAALEVTISGLKKSNSDLSAELDRLKKTNDKVGATNPTLSREIRGIRNRMKKVEGNNVKLSKEIEGMKTTNRRVEGNNSKLSKEIDGMKSRINRVEENNSELSIELLDVRTKLQQSARNYRALETDRSAVKSDILSLNTSNKVLSTQIDAMARRINTLETHNTKLSADLDGAEDWMEEAEDRYTRLNEELQALKRQTSGVQGIQRSSSTWSSFRTFNPCSPNPCENEGSCRDTDTDLGYACDCRAEFYGDRCEKEYHPCDRRPCQNGGSCRRSGQSYICSCDVRHTGTNCEFQTRCVLGYCKNGGRCRFEFTTGFICECRAGYSGDRCEQFTTLTENSGTSSISSACIPNPCGNGGECRSWDRGYSCKCPRGFTGVHCFERTDSAIQMSSWTSDWLT